jgi:hypothetical protein
MDLVWDKYPIESGQKVYVLYLITIDIFILSQNKKEIC